MPSRKRMKLQFFGRCLLGLAGLGGAVATPAWANTLPPASTFVECSADGSKSFDSTSCTTGGVPGTPSFFSASTTLSPLATAIANASSPPEGVFGAGGDASVAYYFEVTGGEPFDLVPIVIVASLTANSTGGQGVNGGDHSFARAVLTLGNTAEGLTHIVEVCAPAPCGSPFSGILSTRVLTSVGITELLTLRAEAHASATRVSNESSSAFADPYIFIDPAFPNASLYSIVVSSGVGNTPLAAAPEPAMLGLAGTALGALALRWRRRFPRPRRQIH